MQIVKFIASHMFIFYLIVFSVFQGLASYTSLLDSLGAGIMPENYDIVLAALAKQYNVPVRTVRNNISVNAYYS